MSVEVIPAAEVAAQEQERKSLVAKFAAKYGLEANKLMTTLKATAFKGDVTNEQMAALLIVADQYDLNPWTKEIFAFPSQNGIVPVVGVDGWAQIINRHPQFDGMEFAQDDEKCTCTIYRKDRSHPVAVTEYHAECARGTQPWKTHPRRMLRHKAMIQCARVAFSFAGIYDPDEAERIVDAEEIDVTPERTGPIPWQEKAPKISPKRMRQIIERIEVATKAEDFVAIGEIFSEFGHAEQRSQIEANLRSWERTAVRKLLDQYDAADCGVNLSAWSLEVLGGCQDLKALQVAWNAIERAYDENGVVSVPADVEQVYRNREKELSI